MDAEFDPGTAKLIHWTGMMRLNLDRSSPILAKILDSTDHAWVWVIISQVP